jgi:hypothetical protein
MPWYVAWAPTPSNGRLGVFIAFPPIIVVGQEVVVSIDERTGQSGAHRTCTIHCPVPWPRQPTVGVCSNQPLDPTVARSSRAHWTVRCYSPRAPSYRPLCTDCLVSHQTVRCTPDMLLFTVRCATSALADCPLHGFLRCFFWASFPLESWTYTHLLCLLLWCCILSVSVQSCSHHVGKITMPITFGYVHNTRTEQVVFDIVDMDYPYNAIIGRGTLNAIEAILHPTYLCMKIPSEQAQLLYMEAKRLLEKPKEIGQIPEPFTT